MTTLQPDAAKIGGCSCIASNTGRATPFGSGAAVLTAAHGGLELQVFGSVVRGSARPGSDDDLLVDFPASPSFEQVMDLKLALEDLLSVPVDLVNRRGLRAELRQRTEEETNSLV